MITMKANLDLNYILCLMIIAAIFVTTVTLEYADAHEDETDEQKVRSNSTSERYRIYNDVLGGWTYQDTEVDPNLTVFAIVNIFPIISEDPNVVTSFQVGIENLQSSISLDQYARKNLGSHRINNFNFTPISSSTDANLSGRHAYKIGLERKSFETGAIIQSDVIKSSRIDTGDLIHNNDPNEVMVLKQRANELHQLGKYNEAIDVLDEALILVPNDVAALSNKGFALNKLGRSTEAMEYYDMAIAVDPSYILALKNKADVLYNLGRSTEAMEYYDKALAVDPNDMYAITGNADTLRELGRYSEALQYYDKALAVDPDDLIALSNRADTLSELGRYSEALQYYDKALAVDPDDLIALNNKGFALSELGRYSEALQYYDKALAVDPDYVLSVQNKAEALYALGRSTEAIEVLNQTLSTKN